MASSIKSGVFKPENTVVPTAMARARERVGKIAGAKIRSPMDEVRLTQEGVSTTVYSSSFAELGANVSEFAWIIKPRTLTHRKSKRQPLTQEESGRWLRAAKTQALAIEVFGNPDKASTWLHKPRKMFDGLTALDLLQTEAGGQLVEDTLNQIDHGMLP